MKISQLAVQLYTVRDFCGSASELAKTARRIRGIGYTAVQTSGLERPSEAEISVIMADAGLVICSAHQPPQMILDHPEECIKRITALGCKLAAYPFPEHVDFTSDKEVTAWLQRLDASGKTFAAAGVTLGYHNHAMEFVRLGNLTILEHIYARTDPNHIVAELDSYWIHYGGGDVVEWCRQLRGRLPFIHLKDYALLPNNTPTYCEVGSGVLPFDRIVAQAEASGCRWFIVEQDTCIGDPFASLERSFEFLRGVAESQPARAN